MYVKTVIAFGHELGHTLTPGAQASMNVDMSVATIMAVRDARVYDYIWTMGMPVNSVVSLVTVDVLLM